MTIRTRLAYLATAVVIAYGAVALLNPGLAARLAGLEIIAVRGVSEVRASYGALYLTMGIVLLWALPLRPRGVLLVRGFGLLLAGMTGGRLVSMLVDSAMTVGNAAWLLASLLLAAILIGAGFETPPSRAERKAQAAAAQAKREAADARAALTERRDA
jgi:hypothetical protein